jgi:hypothetical protein
VEECNPYDRPSLKPWMQDHIMAGVWCGWRAGSDRALPFVRDFSRNWIVGRATKMPQLSDGSPYRYAAEGHITFPGDAVVNTWAELAAAARRNVPVADGWDADGNYAQLHCRSLSLVGHMLKETQAPGLCAAIQAAGAIYVNADNYRGGGTDYVRCPPLV